MIYVVTAIMNGWDNLRPPAIVNTAGARFICFTDLPVLPKVEPWEYRPLHPAGPDCRTSRVPKILPHLMLPSDAEYSIWHDGNLQLRMSPEAIIQTTLSSADWAAHKHPARQCIYQEAQTLLSEKIGTPELVREEIARYRDDFGFPENAGLWANGFLVRRHTPAVAALNELWWRFYASGCERDQLSFPVARQSARVNVETIYFNIYQSPFTNFYFHAAWKDNEKNIEFRPERSEIRVRMTELYRLTHGSVSNSPYPEY